MLRWNLFALCVGILVGAPSCETFDPPPEPALVGELDGLLTDPAAPVVLRFSEAIDPATLTPSVRQAVREMDPSLALADIATGDDLVAAALSTPRYLTVLIGMFAAALGKPAAELATLPDPFGAAPIDQRARAYLHSNCSMCHRPDGGPARAPMDFRFDRSFADTKSCNVASGVDDIGVPNAKIIVPGKPEQSLVSVRMHATNGNRMPPLGTKIVDEKGTKLIDDWIRGVTCP